MDINKALRVEKKRGVRFYILMGFIAVLLPLSLWLTGIFNSFFIFYVVIMEILIALVILKRADRYKLEYSYKNNKLTFKSGVFGKKNLLLCDKISLVHTDGIEEDVKIIVITTIKFRNSRLKPVVEGLLKRYPEMADEYRRVKNVNPNDIYYYLLIKKGGLKKYTLLGDIYTYCAKSAYTEEAVTSIKISRGYTID
ncbi:hypothetical protein [uncultured Clostridium sp.]|uniref:hypothetical protein n=1 Tax=uncultured Clostridium sp. TaxID=59620 RepID=UPI0026275095|nr:hypothetical protein [uncultured Clostridium sp.]